MIEYVEKSRQSDAKNEVKERPPGRGEAFFSSVSVLIALLFLQD